MKRFLLGGSVNPHNRGDQARIKGTIRALRESGADIRLALLSHNYEEDVKVYGGDGIDIVRTPWSRNEVRLFSMGLVALSTLVGQAARELFGGLFGNRFRSRFKDYDGFIIISGIDFSDYVGRWPMYYGFFLITLFRLVLGTPVMLYAQSLGPVEHPLLRKLTRYFLNQVKIITLREEYSLAFLHELGISRPDVHLTADPAYLLEPEKPVSRVRNGTPVIGVTASPAPFAGPGTGYCSIGLWYRVNQKNRDNLFRHYAENMAHLCDTLIQTYDARLIFIPNCLAPNDDDRESIRHIYGLMENRTRAGLIDKEMTLAETMAAIGQCDFFVGTRLHAEILASIQGIPLLPLVGTDGPRVPGVMKTLGLENYICNIASQPDGHCLSMAQDIMNARESYLARLSERVSAARQQAQNNIALLHKF